MGRSAMANKDFTYYEMDFIDHFNGSIVDTAEELNVSYGYLRRLMMKPKIRKAIQQRLEKQGTAGIIADIQEMQIRLTEIIRAEDDRQPGDIPVDRDVWLKSVKLLGSSQCMFSEKRVIEGGDKPVSYVVREIDVQDRIRQQLEDDDDI